METLLSTVASFETVVLGAGLWHAGSARWHCPLQPVEEPELSSLKAEALDVAQETARIARSVARTAAALQRSLKDPSSPLQVSLHRAASPCQSLGSYGDILGGCQGPAS